MTHEYSQKKILRRISRTGREEKEINALYQKKNTRRRGVETVKTSALCRMNVLGKHLLQCAEAETATLQLEQAILHYEPLALDSRGTFTKARHDFDRRT
jgi:hypothetical protein